MAKKPPPMFRQGDLIHVRLGPYDSFGRREQFKARIVFEGPRCTRLIVLCATGCLQATSDQAHYAFLDPLYLWAAQTAQYIQESRTK